MTRARADASERLDFAEVPDPFANAARPIPEARAPAEASPTRAAHHRRVWIVEVLIGVWLLAAAFRLGVRPDVGAAWFVRFAALCVVGLAAHRLAVTPHDALGPRLRVAQAIVVLVPLAFVVQAFVGSRGAPEDDGGSAALGACFGTTLVVALVPLALTALIHRRAFAAIPAWRGAVLGTTIGLLASLVMSAHCTVDACLHVLLAHGAPIVLGGLAGAAFGARSGRL